MRWSRFFLSARPLQAVLQTLFVGVLAWLLLLVLRNSLSPLNLQLILITLMSPISVLFCTLRLQLPKGSWRRQGIHECILASVLSLLLNLIMLACIVILVQNTTSRSLGSGDARAFSLPFIALILDIVVFIFFRIVIRIWLLWNRLRRKQLLWALTHSHIMLVALSAGLLILLIDVVILHSTSNFYIVPATFLLVILSSIALMLVVPPLALFSYFVVRRTTRRLKTLAAATSALRTGNYATRVPVIGEDEVAQLQVDFNAMAADLERTMHELQEERDRVTGLLQSRRELIANVSHELRTPTATLRSYLETTLAHWDDNSQQELQQSLHVMEHEVIRLQGLIEDLFALSRAEVGKLTLRCEPTDIGMLVQRIVDTAAPLAWRSSKVEMVVDITPDLPPVLVDANRLEQVLHNLLHNAVRHTLPGGIVAVAAMKQLEFVVLQVKDTGEGIPAEDLPHIWERFYQTESTRTRLDGGTGLGLTLVKEWIEVMGGTVEARGVVGEGSCFTIRLPRMCDSKSC